MSKQPEGKNSIMWDVLREQGKANKRLVIALIIVVVAWFLTITGFVWYLSQYDYCATETTTTVTVDGADGTATYQRGEGNEITYG